MVPKSRIAKTSCYLTILVICLGLGPTTRAQDQSQTIGKEFQGTIFSPSLESVSLSKGNLLVPTLILESSYDTNLLQSQSGPTLAGIYQVAEGQLKYDVRRPGNDLLLTYWGGERIYPSYSTLNTTMQDVRLQWQHRITNRITFAATSRWARLPGGAVLDDNQGQGFPLVGAEPSATSFLQQRLQTSQITAMIMARLTQHISFVVGSNFFDTSHSGETLINNKELDGYGGIYYSPTRHQEVGLMLAQQSMKFGLGFGTAEVRSLFMTYSLGITPKVSISAFGGPSEIHQFASVFNNSGSLLGFSPATQTIPGGTQQGLLGGAKLERRDKRNMTRLSYSQLITGGSGYLSSVLQRGAELSATRSISPRLDVSLSGTYSQNAQIGLSGMGFHTYYVGPSISYRVGPDLKFTLRDSYGKITGLASGVPINREEVSIRLEYGLPSISVRK